MICTSGYDSPLGGITLAGDDTALTGLWFDGQRYFGSTLPPRTAPGEPEGIRAAKRWLDTYFSGGIPAFLPPLRWTATPFQQAVWELLLAVPYGSTVTYGQLAARLAAGLGRPHMSAQAVGGAVGRNPISLIVPCHRVVGANGALTGYAAGVDVKIALLQWERADIGGLYLSGDTTAL